MFKKFRSNVAIGLVVLAERVSPRRQEKNPARVQGRATHRKESRRVQYSRIRATLRTLAAYAESTLRIAGVVFCWLAAYAIAYFALCFVLGIIIGVGNAILA